MIQFQNNQFIVVTGAGSGIGKAVALMLNKLGAGVIAVDISSDGLQSLHNEAACSEQIYNECFDLTADIAGLPVFVSEMKEKYGKLSGLVCAAGMTQIKPLQLSGLQDYQKIFNLNYFAPIFLAKGFLDRRVNIGSGAAVVFISSIEAITARRAMGAYAGSKAALSATAKTMAKEVSQQGIRVNCIMPGDVKTPMTEAIPGMLEERAPLFPLGIGQPEDIAALAAFLLSDKAGWITGKDYIIDGGFL